MWRQFQSASGPSRLAVGILLVWMCATPLLIAGETLLGRHSRISLPAVLTRSRYRATLAIGSPIWATGTLRSADNRGDMVRGLLIAGFTPAWIHGFVRWAHPPGLLWTLLVMFVGGTATAISLYADRWVTRLWGLFGTEADHDRG